MHCVPIHSLLHFALDGLKGKVVPQQRFMMTHFCLIVDPEVSGHCRSKQTLLKPLSDRGTLTLLHLEA